MGIEISGNSAAAVPVAGNGVDAKRTDSNATNGGTGQQNQATDTITLTSSALNMNTAEQKLKDVPIVDTDRVEQIRKAIKNGEYSVDPVKIADKFVSLESSLYS